MWIRTTAKFRSGIPDVEWDMMDEDQQEDSCTIRKFRFNTDRLEAYNESKYGITTIRMKSGYELTVDLTVEELDKIIFVD